VVPVPAKQPWPSKFSNRVGADQIAFLQHDSYYKDLGGLPPTQHANINFDHPNALDTDLLIEHITHLRAGQPVEVPIYDFSTDRRNGPAPSRCCRGLWYWWRASLIFVEAALRQLFDIKIFVDTDSDIRFIRRLERDITERGRTDGVGHQTIPGHRPSDAP